MVCPSTSECVSMATSGSSFSPRSEEKKHVRWCLCEEYSEERLSRSATCVKYNMRRETGILEKVPVSTRKGFLPSIQAGNRHRKPGFSAFLSDHMLTIATSKELESTSWVQWNCVRARVTQRVLKVASKGDTRWSSIWPRFWMRRSSTNRELQ